MELQTKIPLEKQLEHQIDYTSNVLLIGSCFSDNIGAKLDYYKFQNVQNPFGVLFHPKAIETLIHSAVSGRTYLEKDVICAIFSMKSLMNSMNRCALFAVLLTLIKGM